MNKETRDARRNATGTEIAGEDLVARARVDRTVISYGTLEDEGDERAYWHARTPDERLEALELMRQILYGYDPATERLQRVLEYAELK